MTRLVIGFALAALPLALGAQDSTASRPQQQQQPAFSAKTQAQLDATLKVARQHGVPEQPIRDRIAEGRVKGATEAQIVVAAQNSEAQLEASQHALVSAGHPHPTADQITAGAQAMDRAASNAQATSPAIANVQGSAAANVQGSATAGVGLTSVIKTVIKP